MKKENTKRNGRKVIQLNYQIYCGLNLKATVVVVAVIVVVVVVCLI